MNKPDIYAKGTGVERYSIYAEDCDPEIEKSRSGNWVRYLDHARLQEQLEAVTREVEELASEKEALLNQICRFELDVQAAEAGLEEMTRSCLAEREGRLAAEARAARLEAALRAVDQHERSSFFGPDGDKSRRASWRGAIRKVRAALDVKEAR